jgi:hypothetical protein
MTANGTGETAMALVRHVVRGEKIPLRPAIIMMPPPPPMIELPGVFTASASTISRYRSPNVVARVNWFARNASAPGNTWLRDTRIIAYIAQQANINYRLQEVAIPLGT